MQVSHTSPLPKPAQDQPRSRTLGIFVLALFRCFNEHALSWAVLRGSDQLPDRVRYDIDILIAPSDLARAEKLLDEVVRECGWRRIALINKLHYRCHILASPGAEPRFLPIDFFTGCDHRFYPFAKAATGLTSRQMVAPDIWAVPPGFGAVVALVKELMRHDVFKENSRAEVRHAAERDAENFLNTARDYLGSSLGERLLKCVQAGDWEGVEGCAPDIRRRIQRRRVALLPRAFGFFGKNILHHLRPPLSAFVVLLGPDGSGKSTIARELCARLYQRPFKVCKHFEYNFRLLPELKTYSRWLRKCLGQRVRPVDVVQPGTRNSGMNRDHPPLRAMFYIAYYSLDLLIGRLYLRKLRGQSALVVFARYFHDYYYQRGYGRAPRWFIALVEKLVPAPDLIFYLDRDAGEIYAGKPELEVAEIQRQQQIILGLLSNRANAAVVDASSGVDATVEQVRRLILDTILCKPTR